jgi:hypothetical protein
MADLPSMYTGDLSLTVLGDMWMLKKKYASAESWLQSLVGRLEDRIVSCRGVERDVHSLAFLCDSMGDMKRLMSVYEKARESDCETLAQEMAVELTDELIRTRRYSEINARQEAEEEISRYTGIIEVMKSGSDIKNKMGPIHGVMLNSLLENVGAYYRCLLLARMDDDAKVIADALLKATSGSSEAYLCLAWNGYLSGRVNDDHLAYVRKAYEMPPEYKPSKISASDLRYKTPYRFRMTAKQMAAVLLVKLYRERGMREAARTLAVEAAGGALTWDQKLVFEELQGSETGT